MDGAVLKRIRRYALAKATLAEAASIKTVEKAMCLRGGFMGVEGLHFDDDDDDDEDNEDDEYNIISFLRRIRDMNSGKATMNSEKATMNSGKG